MKTEQRSLRLSRHYLFIVEELQENNDLSFTGAIKHIISEFGKSQDNKNSLNQFFQKLEKKIKSINPSAANDPLLINPEIVDELEDMNSNIHLILKALMIIGSADPRTLIEIESLLKENE